MNRRHAVAGLNAHDRENSWCCPDGAMLLCYGRHMGGYRTLTTGARIIDLQVTPPGRALLPAHDSDSDAIAGRLGPPLGL